MSSNNPTDPNYKNYSGSHDIRTIPQHPEESQVKIELPDNANATKSQSSFGNSSTNSAGVFSFANVGLSDATVQQLTRLTDRQKAKQQQNVNATGNNWGLGYLAQYYDVTTDDVLQRIIWSAIPIRKAGIDIDESELNEPLASNMVSSDQNDLFSPSTSGQYDKSSGDRIVGRRRYYSYMERYIQSRPDIYGPFWVCVTLMFTIAIFSNLSSFIDYKIKLDRANELSLSNDIGASGQSNTSLTDGNLKTTKEQIIIPEWRYSVEELNMAASLITFYLFLVPSLVWTMFWFGGYAKFYTLMETICAFGYSLSIFIPVSALFISQEILFRYIIIALGSVLSGLALMLSFFPIVQHDSNFKSGIHLLLIAIPGLQFCFGYVLHRITLQLPT